MNTYINPTAIIILSLVFYFWLILWDLSGGERVHKAIIQNAVLFFIQIFIIFVFALIIGLIKIDITWTVQ